MTRWIVLPLCLLLLSVIMLSCSGRGPDTRTVRAVPSTDATPPSTSPPPSTTTTTRPPPTSPVPRATARSAPTPRTTVSTVAVVDHGQSLGSFVATCYGDFEGYKGYPGKIATDPSVIPRGTHLVVEGYGPGVADDTGGDIKGNRIDVWMHSASACAAWGRHPVEVWAG